MDSSSEDEIYDFINEEYNKESEFVSANNSYNDQHFIILKEISQSFCQRISEENKFDIYHAWTTYSEQEPIEINLNVIENTAGVFDIVKSDNIINKVIAVFAILAAEIQTILGPTNLSTYETLNTLVVYGEVYDESERQEDSDAEIQIARMLPFLLELYEKCTKLISIGINLIKQMIGLYNKNFKTYNDSFKNITLYKPFEYLARILSFFNTIDCIVNENEYLTNHWRLYRNMFLRCKSDPIRFGFTENQARKLNRIVRKIDASLLSGKMFASCVKNIIDNTRELQQDGSFISPIDNKVFSKHFTNYIKFKIENITREIESLTETDEKLQLFQLISLFSYYCKIFENNTEKIIFKQLWNIQKKITSITLMSHINFSIEKFLTSLMPWGPKNSSVSLDPKNVKDVKMEYLSKFNSTFEFFVMNIRLMTLTWISRMESNLFETKVSENIGKLINLRVKMIVNGFVLASRIKNNLTYCLNTHLNEGVELKGELIGPIITCLELLKVIEHQFNKSKSNIASSINMMTRVISYSIKFILDPVDKKLSSSSSNDFTSDIHACIKILFSNLASSPTNLRMIVSELCLDIIKSKNFLHSNKIQDLTFNYWKLELIKNISYEIKSVCDCSFFYWYRAILPECLNYLSSNSIDLKSSYFFTLSISDTDKPLLNVKYLEDNSELVKKYRENIFNQFIENFGIKISREIENDLRLQTHSILINNFKLANPCKGTVRDLKKYLRIKPLILFEKIFNLKNFVEDYLNKTFYDLTSFNLNDWKTYQQMRILAKTKFDLHLHDIDLPKQNLDQGLDILFIIRNIVDFVQNYNFNFHSQVFVEVTKDNNNNVTVIGVQQILNSLNTHGIGIVNTIVNKTFQFLGQRMKIITQFTMDEFIKSSIMVEKRYWVDNKEKLQNKYPYERAENLCNDIKNILKTKDELTLMDKLRNFISQIGNALGFIRIIRAALMEFNSHNLKFFSDISKFAEFQNLINHIDATEMLENPNSHTADESSNEFLVNIINGIVKTNKIFAETLSILDQKKENNINYLKLLLDSFENVFTNQNIPDLDLFFYLIPAVTINYVENSIIAKDKILKKNIKEAFFTDDGFILGVAFLLKIFKQEDSFDSLQWFQSVVEIFVKDSQTFNNKKLQNKKSYNSNSGSNDILQQNMSLKKITHYKNEFELLYFTYNSASIVFNDY